MIAAVPRIPSDYSNPDEVMIVFFYFVPAQAGRPVELSPEFVRNEGECEIELAMPGVDPDDIEIHFRDRQVFVAAKVSEGEAGNFYGAMTLPREYGQDNLGADFDGEVLRITLHQNETLPVSERVIYV